MAGSEKKGQIWGGGLGFEVPVGPSVDMAAEGRGVKERARVREGQVRRKECLGTSAKEPPRSICSQARSVCVNQA